MHPKSQKNLKVVVDVRKELRKHIWTAGNWSRKSRQVTSHIVTKVLGRTGKLSLWAKIVGHLINSRWWWPDLDHKITCPTWPAWVPDPPCVGKPYLTSLCSLRHYLAQILFTIDTTTLFDLYKYCLHNCRRWFTWDRCVGKSSLTLSCFSSFQCFGNVGIKFPILCTTHVLRIPNKTW